MSRSCAGGGADRLELLHHVDLGQPALRRGPVEPDQELGHRRPVAQVRGTGAGDLRLGLAGLGQDAGIALPDHLRRAGGGDPVRHPGRRAAWSTATRPRSASSRRAEGLRRPRSATSGPRWARSAVVGLGGIGEELDPAVAVQDGEGERHRGPGDVGAAHVQKPRDRIRKRQHRRREVALDQPAGDLGALVRRVAPGELDRMRHDRPQRRRRLVGPDPVDQVLDAHEPDLARPERRLERLDLLRGVEPGVEAEPPAARQRLDQPVGRLVLGMAPDLEAREVDLSLHLQPVAAVDEDDGPVAGDGGEPGRAGEAGQPGQPLVARRDVLALVGVGARDEEGVDPGLRHRGAQRLEPRRGGVRRGPAVEVLQHRRASGR